MMRGKTISIYLPEGNPRGIKICENPSSIARAIFIPRKDISKALDNNDLTKVGIYFLFSEKDDLFQFKTYIGEAEEVRARLKQHDKSKKDWDYMVCFVSSKNNLNKGHVGFLESFCYEQAKKIGRTKLINSCSPLRPTLTPSETDFALDFFDQIKLILGMLGYPILDEVKKEENLSEIFYCKGKDANAKGTLTEEGFVVFEGSTANLLEVESAREWVKDTRDKLIDNGTLKEENQVLKFTKNFIFGSPSTAAAVVLARRVNGWILWKDRNGKTLDELKRKSE